MSFGGKNMKRGRKKDEMKKKNKKRSKREEKYKIGKN